MALQRVARHPPEALALAAKRHGALLVHYSTDYVYDGTKIGVYTEADATAPRSAYCRSKLAGEEAVRASGADHLIFRTSWVYASRGKNFLKTILRLAAEREELRIVADQIGAPTWARLLADSTAFALRHELTSRGKGDFQSGTYHLTAAGETLDDAGLKALADRLDVKAVYFAAADEKDRAQTAAGLYRPQEE